MVKRKSETSLYYSKEADALTRSEQEEEWRIATDRKKVELILQCAEGAKSLLDIGCGWGQILLQLVGKIPVLAGVDESPDRLAQLKNNKFGIKVYQNRASQLDIKDESFDIILTSHVMHELKMFKDKEELMKTLSEIRRVLKMGGRYFIIDHHDPGEGEVTIGLRDKTNELLRKFIGRFQYKKADAKINGMKATLSKRDCHDFITKIWSIDGDAERLEMEETHTIINKEELERDLKEAGFEIKKWITFNSIKKLMDYYSIKLIKGEYWDRQFMLIGKKR